MEISNTSKTFIKELAEFIALEYDEIITPLERIIESEGVIVFYDDYGNAFDGIIVYDSLFYIHINTKSGNRADSARGRFTLAHELGHYFIDNHRNGLQRGLLEPHPSKNNEDKHQKIEREADYFASCLLMPEERFSKDCLRRKFSFSIIEELAEKYHVSLTACAIRFSDIGNHPIMIVYCEDNEVKWNWNSNDFPFKKIAKDGKRVPEDTLVGEYFKTGKGFKRTEQLLAGDWFNCYNYTDEGKRIYEHFIPHKNKVLSVIWED
jgi:Zn-dependent peptidase ImmA (M78 family)